jgi:hypothetical protein
VYVRSITKNEHFKDAALAARVMVGPLSMAGTASARQNRRDVREERQDARNDRRDNRHAQAQWLLL